MQMSASQHARAITGAVAALLLFAATAFAADADLQKVLAPTGKLRAALYPGTPTSIVDPRKASRAASATSLGKNWRAGSASPTSRSCTRITLACRRR